MNHGVDWDVTKEAGTTTVETLLKDNDLMLCIALLVPAFPTPV